MLNDVVDKGWINKCILDIRTWMIQNRLKLIIPKTIFFSFNFLVYITAF